MTPEPYTPREIDHFHGEIKDSLVRIETQVRETNGRVTTLERWKYIMMGSVGVLTTIVVPILAWALWVLVNIQGQVHEAVDSALSAYEIME